jgi:hypothetical protein
MFIVLELWVIGPGLQVATVWLGDEINENCCVKRQLNSVVMPNSSCGSTVKETPSKDLLPRIMPGTSVSLTTHHAKESYIPASFSQLSCRLPENRNHCSPF